MALATLMRGAATAGAQVIAEGFDCWETEPETTTRLPDLPADFFGPGSCQDETEMQWLDLGWVVGIVSGAYLPISPMIVVACFIPFALAKGSN